MKRTSRRHRGGIGRRGIGWLLLGTAFLPLSLEGQTTVRVTNLVPDFVAWHAAATAAADSLREVAAAAEEPVDSIALAELRRELWEVHLGEAGTLLARETDLPWEPDGLESAWPRYEQGLDRIRGFAGGELSPAPEPLLRQVAGALGFRGALEVHLVLHVGTFGERPAFRHGEGEYAVLLPVEALPGQLRPVYVDLFTRAVHARRAGRPADGRLSLAEELFIRGLALRTLEELTPGRPAEEYLGRSTQALIQAEGRDAQIMNRMRGLLAERDPERLAPLLGDGATAQARADLDYAAWRVSGLLLMEGWTIDRMVEEPFAGIQPLVVRALGG